MHREVMWKTCEKKKRKKEEEENKNKVVRVTCGYVFVGARRVDASGPIQTWNKSGRQMGHIRIGCPFRLARWKHFSLFFLSIRTTFVRLN
jgi:hypothetical protein